MGSFVDVDIYGRKPDSTKGMPAEEQARFYALRKLEDVVGLSTPAKDGEFVDCDIYGRRGRRVFSMRSRAASFRRRSMSQSSRKSRSFYTNVARVFRTGRASGARA